ncbi:MULTISPECIES: lysozyme family protein [unclassified Enterococcus]|uniref:lysozyme family protein n=1 Tax=unclassified Enterococcus TaxID=2608891 RepID=UPI001A9B82FE|nr:lysozyme family protein [Enterococcus sp. DIV1271a]
MFRKILRVITGEATKREKVMLALKTFGSLFFTTGGLFLVFIFVSVTMIISMTNSTKDEGVGSIQNIPADVLKWESYFVKEAQKYDIVDHVPILMAITTVETGGRLPDIMQSSESAGLPMNTIDNETDSIAQGVKHYANALQLAEAVDTDKWAVVQAYNFGTSYIGYVSQRGKKHTIDLAEAYSKDVVAPSLGNVLGNTYRYVNAVSEANGRPYLYWNGGNFHYVDLVRQYLSQGEVGSNEGFILPLSPPQITSWFGTRVLGGVQEFHRGIDFGHPQGTPIKAIADGVVIASEYHYSWGNYVRIEHANGYCSLYAHNVSNNVKVGDQVKQGDIIGHVGNTGNSFGAHLHLEISTSRDLSIASLLDPAEVLGISQ